MSPLPFHMGQQFIAPSWPSTVYKCTPVTILEDELWRQEWTIPRPRISIFLKMYWINLLRLKHCFNIIVINPSTTWLYPLTCWVGHDRVGDSEVKGTHYCGNVAFRGAWRRGRPRREHCRRESLGVPENFEKFVSFSLHLRSIPRTIYTGEKPHFHKECEQESSHFPLTIEEISFSLGFVPAHFKWWEHFPWITGRIPKIWGH